MAWEDILAGVEKPGRYIGGEVNSARKGREEIRLRFLLAFPDVYEVGMSHLGLQILYAVLNCQPCVAAERCYAPWPDMEEMLRAHRRPLASLETRSPISSFDIIGFSLQYELSFTNVLAMLELGHIPLRSSDREEGHPLIIAGGPCVFNPAPMAPFMDAFVIGEGEEAVVEIARIVMDGKGKRPRRDLLGDLASLDGVYVPALHERDRRIRKRTVTDLDAWPFPCQPLVPLVKTIHDRVVLEIARGCTRGCRFCQAGMVWRPVRERSPETLMRMADEMLARTGYDELSLLSLSAGDYSRIDSLLATLMERYYDRRVALALPSLRVETLTVNLIDAIRRVRKTSFTLAPEAGTQRLRDVINKANTDEDLLQTVRRVFTAGWQAVKLYFMIGLPGETDDDLEGIVDLAYRVLGEAGHKGQVTVSLSTFVPKPHTPFQWHGQIDLAETMDKQSFIKRRIRNKRLNVRWHDARMSFLEGLLSRGDEGMGLFVEEAFRRGCRFDGWSDRFDFTRWEEAIEALGIDPAAALRERTVSESLPWAHIDCGIDRSFLLAERERSRHGELTADCRGGVCQVCGVCDGEMITKVTTGELARLRDETQHPVAGRDSLEIRHAQPLSEGRRHLFAFAKRGSACYLGHLDITAALLRAMAMAELPVLFSQGFHPHPRVSFAVAAPVGMESAAEYGEVLLHDRLRESDSVVTRINSALPDGITLIRLETIPSYAPALVDLITGFTYEATFPVPWRSGDPAAVRERIERFLAADAYPVTREKKGKTVGKDLRPFVEHLHVREGTRTIVIRARNGRDGTVGPHDILKHVCGFTGPEMRAMHLVKVETTLQRITAPPSPKSGRRW